MGKLTNSIDYCDTHCDFGKRGECFFKDKSKCYEKSMRDKLKAYEDIIDEPEKLLIVDKFLLEKCEEINKLHTELAEYKKLEEEHKLIKLTCNVGDTVYYVDDIRKFIDECKVTRVEFKTMNRYHNNVSIEMQGKLWHCINDKLIGEVAFLTQEEAEQALERMKEVL